jgi:hypothetical protein
MAASGALEVSRFDSVDAFEDRAFSFLLEREAEHNLLIGICGQVREGRYKEAYLATVENGGRVVAAAWRTPPHNLGISHVSDSRALDVLASDVRDRFETIPGVLASKDDARRFADIWTTLTGGTSVVSMEQRIYQATEAAMPSGVSGDARPATQAERELLIGWRREFALEATGAPDGAPEAAVDHWLNDATSSGCLVWWDGKPVSMVAYSGPTPNGIRVAPVYTPPQLRGRGYASACTATVTQQRLDEGRRFVFLYTNLANPTSNSIYQKIGYWPVRDVDQYQFES